MLHAIATAVSPTEILKDGFSSLRLWKNVVDLVVLGDWKTAEVAWSGFPEFKLFKVVGRELPEAAVLAARQIETPVADAGNGGSPVVVLVAAFAPGLQALFFTASALEGCFRQVLLALGASLHAENYILYFFGPRC